MQAGEPSGVLWMSQLGHDLLREPQQLMGTFPARGAAPRHHLSGPCLAGTQILTDKHLHNTWHSHCGLFLSSSIRNKRGRVGKLTYKPMSLSCTGISGSRGLCECCRVVSQELNLEEMEQCCCVTVQDNGCVGQSAQPSLAQQGWGSKPEFVLKNPSPAPVALPLLPAQVFSLRWSQSHMALQLRPCSAVNVPFIASLSPQTI